MNPNNPIRVQPESLIANIIERHILKEAANWKSTSSHVSDLQKSIDEIRKYVEEQKKEAGRSMNLSKHLELAKLKQIAASLEAKL